jgi:hypothetical protein
MKHNDYTCRQCGAHFNSRAELNRHNHDQHSMHGRSASESSSSYSSSESQSSQRTEPSSGRTSDEGYR